MVTIVGDKRTKFDEIVVNECIHRYFADTADSDTAAENAHGQWVIHFLLSLAPGDSRDIPFFISRSTFAPHSPQDKPAMIRIDAAVTM